MTYSTSAKSSKSFPNPVHLGTDKLVVENYVSICIILYKVPGKKSMRVFPSVREAWIMKQNLYVTNASQILDCLADSFNGCRFKLFIRVNTAVDAQTKWVHTTEQVHMALPVSRSVDNVYAPISVAAPNLCNFCQGPQKRVAIC